MANKPFGNEKSLKKCACVAGRRGGLRIRRETRTSARMPARQTGGHAAMPVAQPGGRALRTILETPARCSMPRPVPQGNPRTVRSKKHQKALTAAFSALDILANRRSHRAVHAFWKIGLAGAGRLVSEARKGSAAGVQKKDAKSWKDFIDRALFLGDSPAASSTEKQLFPTNASLNKHFHPKNTPSQKYEVTPTPQ